MDLDYKTLGLKCGLECHQQLQGKKLFCDCPAEISDEQPDTLVIRSLHAVAGETGKLDTAAEAEQQKSKLFKYHVYKKYNCLVDIDEEPPHPVNEDALLTTLLVAQLLHAHPFDEIQVMRKTVIDGSNVSGFQRTALIAYDGYFEVDGVNVGIPTICLEEEAAKIVERTPQCDVYNLSRLGIPLIEIATTPDLTTPDMVKHAAEKLGMILRSTKKVKRGLGTIRQDVNVSIKDGARVEIKGAQDLKMLPTLVSLEVQRQYLLVQICDELKKRSVVFGKPVDVTSIFSKTQCGFVQKALQTHQSVYGILVGGCACLLGKELNPNRRIGTELSEYAKVATGAGIMHSDELPKYSISQEEVDDVKRVLRCKPGDAFVITVAQRETAQRALQCVIERMKQAAQGVPQEVRNANQDGTTSYLRPMPGAARMYPETDVKTIVTPYITFKAPELLEETAEKLQLFGLSKDLAELLVKEDKVELFVHCVSLFKNLKSSFIAELLWPKLLEVKRKYSVNVEAITEHHIKQLFEHLDNGTVPKEAVEEILVAMTKGHVNFAQYKGFSDAELEKGIKAIVQSNPGLNFSSLMGKVMEQYRGKVDGKKVSEMVKRLLM